MTQYLKDIQAFKDWCSATQQRECDPQALKDYLRQTTKEDSHA